MAGKSDRIQGSTETRSQTALSAHVFAQTMDLMWMQAQALFGEDAQRVVCDAVKSENPGEDIQQYLPDALQTR